MKVFRYLLVIALFSVFFVSCEANDVNEDLEATQLEEVVATEGQVAETAEPE